VRPSDPGYLALRRGIRAAIAMPVTLALSLFVFDDPSGSVFAVFGIVGLLINADFAGRMPTRIASYLVTGAVGTVLIIIGWAGSFNTLAATALTIVIAFLLGFLNFLRGTVAVGTPAVLLMFVVAVSINAGPGDLPRYLLGWWIAVVVSTITAALILPRDARGNQRARLADVFAAAARGVESTWLLSAGGDAPIGFAEFASAVRRLDDDYSGQPYRTSGVAPRDEALTLLVDHVNSTQLLLADPARLPVRAEAIPVPGRDDLARALADALSDLARAMHDPGFLPSGRVLDDARVRLITGMREWVLDGATNGIDPAEIAARIGGDHQLRMAAIVSEQMVEMARVANGGTVEDLERLPPVPQIHRSAFVRSEFHFRSPWFRNAARSALGLGLAVLVVNLTGVEHGFWVLIGVISILRFDAVGTRAYAVQAVVGTVAGVVVATGLLAFAGTDSWLLWLLLPLTVFLAAWSAVAIGYPVGQAAFSALVLFALAIIAWPPKVETSVVRVEDIALGAGVAFVVAMLMWPRGAIGALRQEAATAIRLASAYLSLVLRSYVERTEADTLEQARQHAVRAAYRASETYDMALMQRGPAVDMHQWTSVTSMLYLLISASRVLAHFTGDEPVLAEHAGLAEGVARARVASDRHWGAVADAIGARSDDSPAIDPAPEGACAYPSSADILEISDASAMVVAVWSIDWVNHLNRLSTARGPHSG